MQCLYIYRHKKVPIGSMYGIFTYIWLIFMVNVGRYTNPMDPMGTFLAILKPCKDISTRTKNGTEMWDVKNYWYRKGYCWKNDTSTYVFFRILPDLSYGAKDRNIPQKKQLKCIQLFLKTSNYDVLKNKPAAWSILLSLPLAVDLVVTITKLFFSVVFYRNLGQNSTYTV